MEVSEFLDFLHCIEPMKTNTRHSWTAGGTPETVAAHSWRLTVMALLLEGEFPQLDMNRVLRMCLIHDFGEAVTGDIPSFLKTGEQEVTEQQAVARLVDTLPSSVSGPLHRLFGEMDALDTPEARLYKALDQMEAVLQHNEADLSTWLPLERELNQTYGAERAEEFPFLKAVREQLRRDTLAKLEASEELPGRPS